LKEDADWTLKLIIHRGTHEIGGSCIELRSNSEKTRIIIDIGLPLVNADKSPFDLDSYSNATQKALQEKKILPGINGLYQDEEPSVSGVLLSHAHIDHFGLLRFVHPDIPIYMSIGTKNLIDVSNIFLNTRVNLELVKTFDMCHPFQIRELTITPYLMDHSAPDAAAFLIESDGQQIFYTGDFRGHGRKSSLLKRLIHDPPPDIDFLVMEGTNVGKSEGPYTDEKSVEEALTDHFLSQRGLCYVFTASQNLDRIVSIYRAAKRSDKILVIDLYTAFILDKLGVISSNIPQYSWKGIRVLYSHYQAQRLEEYDKSLLYKYRESKIEFEEIRESPIDKVLLAKDSRYFRNIIKKLSQSVNALAVYSMWSGYLKRGDLESFLKSCGIPLIEVHISGHSNVKQLQELTEALKPRFIIPIHTFYPEMYLDLFTNIIQLSDDEVFNLS
jgi:ribonuclease J